MIHEASSRDSLGTEVALVCPQCHAPLRQGDASIACSGCDRTWPIENGVPRILPRSDNYWGEPGVSQEVAKDLVVRMENADWKQTLQNHELASVRNVYTFVSNLSRADWFQHLDLPARPTVLDVGAGTGTISHALSPHAGKIYAIERVWERVEFMRHRFRQEKIQNVELFQTDLDNLPFPEKSFDLIIMNGVVEWVPYSRKQDNPRDAQLYYLRKLRSLLKDGGVLYVGIENRTCYHQFMGEKDPHVYIRGVAVLPRFLADIVCKIKIGDRYRPYLYGHRGYQKLMKDAGFKATRLFAAIPSYNDPKVMLDLERPSADFSDYIVSSTKLLHRWLKRVFIRLDILKYLGFAYVIFAYRDRSSD